MRIYLWKKLLCLGCVTFIVSACTTEQNNSQFELLTYEDTGLDFVNDPQQSVEFNVFSYMYFFNGGGVSVGDFNNDGLQDVFFTSNMESNKIFLNKGNMSFEDVTEVASISGQEGWTSGSTVVDINNDGLLDIYVSQIGEYGILKGKNQLYVCKEINDGIPVYEDQAGYYGLDFVGFSTQAAFFDYDLDGDLDMYQLNHSLHHNSTFGKRQSFQGKKHELSGDRLLNNNDGVFTDVSEEAKIMSTVIGYGLGIAISDINLDGWPDIYIGNDFHENDYLYINQTDGTFKESVTEQMRHTSRFSMGVDAADINNDGYSDIISLDMAPEDPYILKTSLGEDAFGIFKFKLGFGYNHQYARNNLQLNNGDNSFSEVGMYAGVDATDWSWAPLLLDFDHDGYKDIFISNGIPRRMNDIDYVKFRTTDDDVMWKTSHNYLEEDELSMVEMMPKIKLPNKFYKNNGDISFRNLEVQGNENSFSNGAAYADFDNDGDLDIVVNNIEDKPFLYKNNQVEKPTEESKYILIDPEGNPKNINAIGARLIAFSAGEYLIAENFPTKGFQSSVQNGLHLGLGDASKVDSVLLIWPDKSYQKIDTTDFNKAVQKKWKPGLPIFDYQTLAKQQAEDQFEDISNEVEIDFVHDENPFVEFNRETLIPGMVSSDGPAIAVGDINGDELEDVFIGGAKRRRAGLYLQTSTGKFERITSEVIKNDSIYEDVDAVLADVENDGDLDLVIASGGNEYRGKSPYLNPRIYINDGSGNFDKSDAFNDIFMTASCVLAKDYDEDGLVDLFFGGRAVPNNHGFVPESYLLKNVGDGKFENVTKEKAPGLTEAGMVKDGNWTDIDSDGDVDLILAVEWRPIQIYLNDGGVFAQRDLNDKSGWWNFVLPFDFDQDGDIDILAGNTGENSKFKPTDEKPVKMYVADFDENDQIEQILTYYKGGKEIPFANFEELTKQLPELKKRYLYAKEFAKASLNELFGKKEITDAIKYEANTFTSVYFENTGTDLKFNAHKLPQELQFSTMEAASIVGKTDSNSTDVMIGGNFYDCNIEMGRYDANFGNILTIGANGSLNVNAIGKLKLDGQIRRIRTMNVDGKEAFVLGINDAPIKIVATK